MSETKLTHSDIDKYRLVNFDVAKTEKVNNIPDDPHWVDEAEWLIGDFYRETM